LPFEYCTISPLLFLKNYSDYLKRVYQAHL
jgi:hypothetical protein